MHRQQDTDLRPLPSSASLPGSLGGLPRQAEGLEGGTYSPDPFDRPTDHWPEQIAEAEQLGTIFAVGQLGHQSTPSLIYNAHHFACPECQAAGRLQAGARRCEVGQPLWADYLQSVLCEGGK